MIVEFSVENYLSFRDRVTLSFVASDDVSHMAHVIDTPFGGILPVAAIYGPNASGKSNLLKALTCFQDIVFAGSIPGEPLPVSPFLLKHECRTEPTSFELLFVLGEQLFKYQLTCSVSHVHSESLQVSRSDQWISLFERSSNGIGNSARIQHDFSPLISDTDTSDREFFEFVARGTRDNQPFLTECAQRNVQILLPLWSWISKNLLVLQAEPRHLRFMNIVRSDHSLREFLNDLIVSSGIGASGIQTKANRLVKAGLSSRAAARAEDLKDGESVQLMEPDGSLFEVSREPDGKLIRRDLILLHLDDEGNEVGIPIEAESDGSKRLLHLGPALAVCLHPHHTLVIDELDRSWHTELSKHILDLLMTDIPQVSSQVLFTTHDTNLLDLGIFRPDELWFMEKDLGGASTLYALAEFKLRPDLNIETGYLNGRFGALPRIEGHKQSNNKAHL